MTIFTTYGSGDPTAPAGFTYLYCGKRMVYYNYNGWSLWQLQGLTWSWVGRLLTEAEAFAWLGGGAR